MDKATGRILLWLAAAAAGAEILLHHTLEACLFPEAGLVALVLHSFLLILLITVPVYLWKRNSTAKSRAESKFQGCRDLHLIMSRLLSISLEKGTIGEMLDRTIDCIVSVPWLPLKPMGGIWLSGEGAGKETFFLTAHRNLPEPLLRTCGKLTPGRCMCGRAAASGRVEYSGSVDERHETAYEGMAPHGHYCVPILYGGSTLGVMNLYLEEGHPRDEDEVEFLTSVAEIIAGMIERKRMEAAVERRLGMETAIAEVSSLLVSGGADMDRVLATLGKAVSVNRAYVFLMREDGKSMDNTNEWCSPGTEPQIESLQGLEVSGIPWWMRNIRSRDFVAIEDVDALPAEAAVEKGIFKAGSIRSLLCVPIIMMDGSFAGFMGFDDTERPRGWSDDDIRLLKVVSTMISADLERKRDHETIRQMAFFDHLTGLPNRRLLSDRLSQVIAAGRWKRRLSAILYIDLDRFKDINDTLGHTFGDEVLKVVAERLRGCVFEGDTVARFGGDEFTVLLHEITRAEDVVSVIRKIYEAMEPPVTLAGQEVYVGASIGVSVYPNDGENAEELLRNSDMALYRAKEEGRGRYSIYSPSMNDKALKRLRLEGMLRKAIEREEFVFHYQPQVELSTGRVIGVEALIRWAHPEEGLIPPMDFIPLAEDTGLIIDIGRWVLRTACLELKRLRSLGLGDIRVAVNISARQFRQRDFRDSVIRNLEEAGVDPRLLDIELTESVIMDHTEEAISTMKELKSAGVRITIDDFGTGYSSLSYLKRLPMDMLKIDRTFVANVPGNPEDESIVITIIRLAHSLRREAIAEGVETVEQYRFLKTLQCDHAQGFLLSKPLAEPQMLEALREGLVPDPGKWAK